MIIFTIIQLIIQFRIKSINNLVNIHTFFYRLYNRFSLFHFVFECKTNLHLIAFNSLFSLHLITKWNFLFEWHHYNESQSMRLLAYSPAKSSTKITSHEMLQRSTHSFGIWFVVRMYCEEDGVFFFLCVFSFASSMHAVLCG